MRQSMAGSVLASALLLGSAGGVFLPGLIAAAPAAAMPGPRAEVPPTGACKDDPRAPGKIIRAVPWEQQLLDPKRVWTQTKGKGVTIGVIDSGIDTSHPQLSRSGKVLPGYDFIRDKPDANFDCISHGTGVASIIGGDRVSGVGFVGLAPQATLLPVRVSDHEATPQTGNGGGDGDAVVPKVFAKAIRYAVDNGATVLNLSLVLYRDVPEVRSAIAYARKKDVVMVAAVGNDHGKKDDFGETIADKTPYPAAYPGVIGVGATTITGTRFEASQVGPYVRIVAPGDGVQAATRQHGYLFFDGTSFAAPYVTGTAALVRSAHPELDAKQVIHRILATADPAPGGSSGPEYGTGIVDPLRAVTEVLGGSNAAPKPSSVRTPERDVAGEKRAAAARARADRANQSVTMVAGFGVVGGLVVGILVLGTRRRWTPTRNAPPDRSDFV